MCASQDDGEADNVYDGDMDDEAKLDAAEKAAEVPKHILIFSSQHHKISQSYRRGPFAEVRAMFRWPMS